MSDRGWPVNANNKIVWTGGADTVVGNLPIGVNPISIDGNIVFVGSAKTVVGFTPAVPVDAVTGNIAASGIGGTDSTQIKFTEAWPVDANGKIAFGGVGVTGYLPQDVFPCDAAGNVVFSGGASTVSQYPNRLSFNGNGSVKIINS